MKSYETFYLRIYKICDCTFHQRVTSRTKRCMKSVAVVHTLTHSCHYWSAGGGLLAPLGNYLPLLLLQILRPPAASLPQQQITCLAPPAAVPLRPLWARCLAARGACLAASGRAGVRCGVAPRVYCCQHLPVLIKLLCKTTIMLWACRYLVPL